jgi:hypothetical protein
VVVVALEEGACPPTVSPAASRAEKVAGPTPGRGGGPGRHASTGILRGDETRRVKAWSSTLVQERDVHVHLRVYRGVIVHKVLVKIAKGLARILK